MTEGAQTRAVEALTPTLTPTIVPSPTVTPSPTLFELPTAPELDVNDYALTLPWPETLIQLDLLNSLPEYDEAAWNQGELRTGGFSATLLFEWQRTFSQNLNQVGQLTHFLQSGEEDYDFYVNSQVIVDILSEAAYQYFNLNNFKLVDQEWWSVEEYYMYGISYQVEIDRDQGSEWLVQVNTGTPHTSFWLTLNENQDGTYSRLDSSMSYQVGYFVTEKEPILIEDLSGDGLTDVLLTNVIRGIGEWVEVLEFVKGSPDGFEYVSAFYEVSEMFFARYDYSYTFSTSPDTGLPMMIVNRTRQIGWNCETTSSRKIHWVNGVEQIIILDTEQPDSINCDIARSVDIEKPPDNQDAIRWLNYAYSQGDLSPENQIYVLFRLALLYSLKGDSWASENYLNAIIELAKNNAHPIAVALAQQLQPLFQQNQILPYKLCLAAESIELPIPYYSYYSGPSAYSYEGLPDGYPTPLCDTREIQLEVLNSLEFDASTSPESVLQDAGFPVLTVEQAPSSSFGNTWLTLIDDDSPDYLAGNVLDFDHKIYLLRFIENEGWDILTSFDYPDYLDWINQDFTGDGIPEIGIVYKYDNPEYTPCELGENQYSAYLLSHLAENWNILYFDNQICLPMNIPFAFEDVLQDKNGDGRVDWVINQLEADNYDVALLETIPATRTLAVHLVSYDSDLEPLISKTAILGDLTTRFFESPTPSLLRPDLEFYRTRWGTGADPTSEQIYAHLTYLLALTYELEGDETQAAALFYDLLANHPDTLWAYLAASRLVLKP
ncbi:MAG: hypothetical protein HUU38_15160 [Anaerolineales bacterium]|nr:hypothetical protein [Anaerolineales bacterium]